MCKYTDKKLTDPGNERMDNYKETPQDRFKSLGKHSKRGADAYTDDLTTTSQTLTGRKVRTEKQHNAFFSFSLFSLRGIYKCTYTFSWPSYVRFTYYKFIRKVEKNYNS